MNETHLFLPAIADGEDKSSPFGNCLRNRYRHLRKWAKRTGTNCFRLYDRDISHYPLAIDFYDGRFCVHYFSRGRDEPEASAGLKEEVNALLHKLFGLFNQAIFWRTRSRSKETRQYEKVDETKEFFTVLEYGIKFQVNLLDYIDTGLFLDHRETRQIVASLSSGKRLLNLFAYTCAFSVHAAAAGATFTKSVDLSNTYTAWGRDNFVLNSLSLNNNEVVRADCLNFLSDEIQSNRKYDVIVIDPPTISRSKKMHQLFDIHIDYVILIKKALKLLLKNGLIIFSTNSRQFVFDKDLFQSCEIIEISDKTLPIDFTDKKIHRCWKISNL